MRNKIKSARKDKGMTQDELAKAAEVTRPYLSDIENGKYKPGGSVMLKIAKALDAKVEDIFFEDDVRHAELGGSPQVS